MKNTKIIIFLLLSSLFVPNSFAEQNVVVTQTKITEDSVLNREINRGRAFNFVMPFVDDLPKSYKYIKLNFSDVKPGTELYDSLQKAVYLDIIENVNGKFNPTAKIDLYHFFILLKRVTGEDFLIKNKEETLKKTILTEKDLRRVYEYFQYNNVIGKSASYFDESSIEFQILNDVYATLRTNFLWANGLKEAEMLHGATKGLVEASGDQFTEFMSGEEARELTEDLNNSVYGVGIIVKVLKPGEILVSSVIEGGGAYKAGLKDGDVIIKVNGDKLPLIEDANEATKSIKGEEGTKVILTIRRGKENFDVEIVRSRVQIPNISTKIIEEKPNTMYVLMRAFGDNIEENFKEVVSKINANPEIKNVIFDVRGNPGGYVYRVEEILNYFTLKGETIYNINTAEGKQAIKSKGTNKIDFSKYNLYVLIDSGTASAAEMFALGVKNIFPDTTLIGEKSYGKASIQTMKVYPNYSTLKYTIAVWTVGEKELKVHEVGIEPDLEISFDAEKYIKDGKDSHLEAVLEKIN